MQSKTEKFIEELKQFDDGTYEYIDGTITNYDSMVKVKHGKCGHEFESSFRKIRHKYRCPYCYGRLPLTTETFKKKLEEIYPGEYEVLSEYVNNKTDITIKHKCGYTWNIRPDLFDKAVAKKSAPPCPICNKKKKKTSEDFQKELEERFPDSKPLVLGELKNVDTPVKVKCGKCNREFSIRPHSALNINATSFCPFCEKQLNVHQTIETFSRDFVEPVEGYSLVTTQEDLDKEGIVFGQHIKVKFHHDKCNTDFLMTPYKFKSGQRCPKCLRSLNEERIESILKSKNIEFETQFSPDDMREDLKRYYRYDFYIPSLNTIIEYDGEYHYLSVSGGRDRLQEQRRRDQEKNEWATKNGYNLVRIPYWEQWHIGEIINDILAGKTPNYRYKTFEEYKNSERKC